jgi:CheY-like chemotaxis protein
VLLLVEDHPDTRQMYAEFLSEWFDVVQAGDGVQALTLVGEQRPDLVITDLSLPGMDGFELTHAVRNHADTSNIPVICMSGYGGQVYEERARRAGTARLLLKPCLPDDLAQTAKDVLRESGGWTWR